jgi:lysophospholipase L1-like esterase
MMNERTIVLLAMLTCGIFPGLAQTAPIAVVDSFGMDDARIVLLGQIDARKRKEPRLGYPGTGLMLRFQGSSLSLHLTSDSDKSALTVVIDHGDPALQLLRKGEQNIVLAAGLDAGPHIAEIYKRTETWQGIVTLLDLALPADGVLLPPSPQPVRKLMFVGDSVTCGAGVENNSTCTADPAHPANDAYHSYGMELGRRLDAQTHLVCYGGRGVERDYRGLGIADNVLNAPQFLDLSIAADEPSNRAPWEFRGWTPDAIFVSLGTNDFNLQKTKPLDANTFVEDYARLLGTLRSHYPRAAIFATEGAIVTDPLLRKYVQDAIAKTMDARIQWVQATHYPGNGCDGHPTKAQHLHMADDIEPVLRKALGW